MVCLDVQFLPLFGIVAPLFVIACIVLDFILWDRRNYPR